MIAAAVIAALVNGAIVYGIMTDKRVRRVARGTYTPLVVHNN